MSNEMPCQHLHCIHRILRWFMNGRNQQLRYINNRKKTTLLRESVELWQEISNMPFALTSSFPSSRYSVILIYLQSFCLVRFI